MLQKAVARISFNTVTCEMFRNGGLNVTLGENGGLEDLDEHGIGRERD